MRVNQDENVIVAGKDLVLILIVADGLEDFGCGVGGRTSSPGAAGLGCAPAIAFDVHLEDRGVMHEPVDCSERHCRVREDAVPLTEGLVGGDEQGSAFVSGADQFEEDGGFRLIARDVGEVVEDEQMVLVELGDGGVSAVGTRR